MLVIMLNCVTLGMFRPCEDVECRSERCSILEVGGAGGAGQAGRDWPQVTWAGCEGCRPSSQAPLLQAFDDFIFAFFAVEMVIKMIALGLFGQKCYLGDTWNRLDFFIVMAGYGPAPPQTRPGRPLRLARPGWEPCPPQTPWQPLGPPGRGMGRCTQVVLGLGGSWVWGARGRTFVQGSLCQHQGQQDRHRVMEWPVSGEEPPVVT